MRSFDGIPVTISEDTTEKTATKAQSQSAAVPNSEAAFASGNTDCPDLPQPSRETLERAFDKAIASFRKQTTTLQT